MAHKPPDPHLVPIRKTQFAQRITRSGPTPSRECWAAETLDGLWSFEREDSPGTPWLLCHRPTDLTVMQYGTLRSARLAVGYGDADQLLTERLTDELASLARRIADPPSAEQLSRDRERLAKLEAWRETQAVV